MTNLTLFGQSATFSASVTNGLAASSIKDWHIYVLLLSCFVLIAIHSATHRDVTQGFDELAHLSYIADVQSTGDIWPSLDNLRMIDPQSFQFTSSANYLNHPSPYYAALAFLGPKIEGHPETLATYRFFNIALASIGLAALLWIGVALRLPRAMLYVYAVPLIFIPALPFLAGSINNDNAAFAGGGIAVLATLRAVDTHSRTAIAGALVGVIIAAYAKLTGLILVGGLVGGVFAWAALRGQVHSRVIVIIIIALVLGSAPYIIFLCHYGSPAPSTHAQIEMLQSGAHAAGWDTARRMMPVEYTAYFFSEFLLRWMPLLGTRDSVNYLALIIPVVAVACALVGSLVSAARAIRGQEGPADIVLVVGTVVLAVTVVIHIVFSYRRHVEFGWMMDIYPRYYLPLAVLVPLGGLSLAAAIRRPCPSSLLVGFLVLSPILFVFLGGIV